MSALNNRVLVLNKAWQAIGEVNLMTAVADMYRGACTGIDTDNMTALRWEDWVKLPVEGKEFIRSTKGLIRAPTVICKAQYSKMPVKRPKLNRRGVGERDKYVCAYSGDYCPETGSVDHVLPRSRGGSAHWTNVVWARKDINHKKSDKTPEEAGLKLKRKPFVPGIMPVCALIPPRYPDWEQFLS